MNLRAVAGALAVVVTAFSTGLLLQACQTLPPRDPDDLCAIFDEHEDWERAAVSSRERWGVPESLLLAVIHQESRFRAGARPGFRRVLGVVPVGRLSSAYGYGQVKDGTFSDYVKATGRTGASRADFADVVDFVGWYGDVIHRVTGIDKRDAYHFYLAYHEGPAGFNRRGWEQKDWLRSVASKVEQRADLYAAQYRRCRPAGAQAAG